MAWLLSPLLISIYCSQKLHDDARMSSCGASLLHLYSKPPSVSRLCYLEPYSERKAFITFTMFRARGCRCLRDIKPFSLCVCFFSPSSHSPQAFYQNGFTISPWLLTKSRLCEFMACLDDYPKSIRRVVQGHWFRPSTCEQEWRSFYLCDFWVDLRNEKAFITFTMLCAWLAPSTPARTRRCQGSQSMKIPLFCFFSCASRPSGLLPRFTTDRGIRPTGCVLETEEDGSERFQEGTTGKGMSAVLLAVFVVSEIYLQRRHGSCCVGVECNEKTSATVQCGGGG
jgi:hypothetical protein